MDRRLRLEYVFQNPSMWRSFGEYNVDFVSEGDRNLDCVAHALGLNYTPSQDEAHRLAKNLKPVEHNPLEGDIILYFHRAVNGFPVHCGIVLDDGRIESKWGNGPVVRHQVEDLPISCDFGSYGYYRKP